MAWCIYIFNAPYVCFYLVSCKLFPQNHCIFILFSYFLLHTISNSTKHIVIFWNIPSRQILQNYLISNIITQRLHCTWFGNFTWCWVVSTNTFFCVKISASKRNITKITSISSCILIPQAFLYVHKHFTFSRMNISTTQQAFHIPSTFQKRHENVNAKVYLFSKQTLSRSGKKQIESASEFV